MTSTLRERLSAGGLTGLCILFNVILLGRATIGLSLGLIFAYALWLFGRWQGGRKRVLGLYFLCIGFFCVHFAEEYLTGFYIDFPRLFGLQWSAPRFLLFNLVWLALFVLSAVGVYWERSIAYVIVIFFALAGGILNGAAHIALSLFQGRLFPGTITAPLMLAGGALLLRRLLLTPT